MVAVGMLGVSALQAGELFPEGTMEIPGPNGMPEGFKHPDPNWLKGFNGQVTLENEEGNNFLRFNIPVADGLIGSTLEIPVPAGATNLVVAWRVRAEVTEVQPNDDHTGRGVCMIASWFVEPPGVADRGYKHGTIDQVQQSTDGWVDKEVVLAVPEGKKFLGIQIGTKGTAAVADFDDVQISVGQ